jgi:hypothetical protein
MLLADPAAARRFVALRTQLAPSIHRALDLLDVAALRQAQDRQDALAQTGSRARRS